MPNLNIAKSVAKHHYKDQIFLCILMPLNSTPKKLIANKKVGGAIKTVTHGNVVCSEDFSAIYRYIF